VQSCKLPVSVLVVVYSAAGSALLLERRVPAGYWQSVTGSLRAGETPAEAARREVAEETGIAGGTLIDLEHAVRYPIAQAWRARYAPGVTENVEHQFALRVDAACDVSLDAREHSAYAWLPFADAIARVASASNRDALERVARGLRP
jgi:dihydroneopterin triphosphate diphosphatase